MEGHYRGPPQGRRGCQERRRDGDKGAYDRGQAERGKDKRGGAGQERSPGPTEGRNGREGDKRGDRKRAEGCQGGARKEARRGEGVQAGGRSAPRGRAGSR